MKYIAQAQYIVVRQHATYISVCAAMDGKVKLLSADEAEKIVGHLKKLFPSETYFILETGEPRWIRSQQPDLFNQS